MSEEEFEDLKNDYKKTRMMEKMMKQKPYKLSEFAQMKNLPQSYRDEYDFDKEDIEVPRGKKWNYDDRMDVWSKMTTKKPSKEPYKDFVKKHMKKTYG